MIKTLASFLIFALFVFGVGFYGNGSHPLFPSLRLLQDTQWDFSLFWDLGAEKILALLLLIPISLGFVGWAILFQTLFFQKLENKTAKLLGFSLAISSFSLYAFGLAVNEILCGPLTFLFFIPALWKGWGEWKSFSLSALQKGKWLVLLGAPLLLWLAEYFSPPIIWDAVLDHFHYAGEVSRLHQILFHWTNHTGDMPKATELILAGFWSIGGESLSKISSALAAVGTAWLLHLFSCEWKGSPFQTQLIFWTCPFFLALFSWGYVEGFLAFVESVALYCLWKSQDQPSQKIWLPLCVFFLGFAFTIKYTAVFAIAAVIVLWLYGRYVRNTSLKLSGFWLAFFFIPLFPWLLKNWLAFDNPFYPLATTLFGTPYGYGSGMEKNLWQDTGLPQNLGVFGHLGLFWKVFFTPENAVAACWTPLVFMSVPWGWRVVKNRLGIFLFLFVAVFFIGWALFCTSLRHAAGGTVVLILLSSMAWDEAFKTKTGKAQVAFVAGVLLSLWLCLSAQFTTTAPYASALGVEDPLLRLKRHYTYDTDTYAAYRFIENHSDPKDKVIAFAVFQTYPLQRTTYVDFKWKRPIFLQWASQCQTAEQLARKLQEEGVRYFLYQQWEAGAMSHVEKDFDLAGIPSREYVKFWRYFMEPVESGENTTVYEVRTTALKKPRKLDHLPGLQEKGFGVRPKKI